MFLQRTVLRKSCTTNVARVWLFPRVDSLVINNIRPLCKTLCADGRLERFVAGMDHSKILEHITALGKSLVTVFTGLGLLFGVYPQMLCQCAIVREGFATGVTTKWLLTCVDPRMPYQCTTA